jgi:hypothetical protein
MLQIEQKRNSSQRNTSQESFSSRRSNVSYGGTISDVEIDYRKLYKKVSRIEARDL